MMATPANIPDIVRQEFAFRAAHDNGALTLRLTGAADARATHELDVFIKRAHEEARNSAVREVVVDLEGLSFMNSSCFKSFVGWLGSISQLAPDSQYKLRFIWDNDSYWQRRSLQALKAFADDVVEL